MQKRTTILAWFLCLLVIFLATGGMVYWLRQQGDMQTPAEIVSTFGWGWAIPVVFAVTGTVIIAR